MHFSSSSIVALAASAAAAAVVPPATPDSSSLGKWNVTLARVKTDESVSDTLKATFTNATDPKGVTHDCEKFSLPGKEGTVSCNGLFTYYYDNATIYVKEMVEGLGKVYSGNASLTLETTLTEDGEEMQGSVIVPVSSSEDLSAN